jgi:hypothetical protein
LYDATRSATKAINASLSVGSRSTTNAFGTSPASGSAT